MVSIEVMKERARIAGRFNLSARRDPEHRALVALAAQRAGGECHVIPAAPGEKVADVFRRSRKSPENQPSSSSPKSTERSTPKSSKPNAYETSEKTHAVSQPWRAHPALPSRKPHTKT